MAKRPTLADAAKEVKPPQRNVWHERLREKDREKHETLVAWIREWKAVDRHDKFPSKGALARFLIPRLELDVKVCTLVEFINDVT